MSPVTPKAPSRINFQDRKIYIFLVMIAVALAYPFIGKGLISVFTSDNTVYSTFSSAFNSTLIYVLLALGLNIVTGFAGLLDLGYAAFFAIGAYTMGFLTSTQSPLNAFFGFQTNFWIALPFCFIMAAVFGILLGAPTLGLKGDYLAIVTLGFGEIVPITIQNLNYIQRAASEGGRTTITGGDSGLNNLIQPNVFGVQFSGSTLEPWYIVSLIIVIASIFAIRRLADSRIGRAWMAMREDEIAAGAMGINLVRTKLLAFGLGASFAGLAGGIFANSLGSANPSQFKFDVSILILAMIILGGLGNIWGVIAGAIILRVADLAIIPFLTDQVRKVADGITLETAIVDGTRVTQPNVLKDILTNVSSNSRLMIFGLILVVMMLVRPEGLFPSGRRKMELHTVDAGDVQPFLAVSEDPLDAAAERNLNFNPGTANATVPDDSDRTSAAFGDEAETKMVDGRPRPDKK